MSRPAKRRALKNKKTSASKASSVPPAAIPETEVALPPEAFAQMMELVNHPPAPEARPWARAPSGPRRR